MTLANLKSKLVFCSVPTKNAKASREFYSALLGSDDFAHVLNSHVEAFFRPISNDGLDLNITQRFDDKEPITCFFAVDNLDAAIQVLQSHGGTVVVKPTPVPTGGPQEAVDHFHSEAKKHGLTPRATAGRMATMLDPDKNYLGLIELDDVGQHHFGAGKFHKPLTHDQVATHDSWKTVAAKTLKP
jgi:predicted enzyme related to lactoylglutathione lyase